VGGGHQPLMVLVAVSNLQMGYHLHNFFKSGESICFKYNTYGKPTGIQSHGISADFFLALVDEVNCVPVKNR
jgi:hypothetical protein